ncbi:hypothetical protein BLOT_016854 [Blomia tropicalis]|nr:hypothetical protein BLOT_016854 [Blomia tropicalis]
MSLLDQNYLNLQTRWKLSTYYELLDRSTKPLLLTVGPLGYLTKNGAFENIFTEEQMVSHYQHEDMFCICTITHWTIGWMNQNKTHKADSIKFVPWEKYDFFLGVAVYHIPIDFPFIICFNIYSFTAILVHQIVFKKIDKIIWLLLYDAINQNRLSNLKKMIHSFGKTFLILVGFISDVNDINYPQLVTFPQLSIKKRKYLLGIIMIFEFISKALHIFIVLIAPISFYIHCHNYHWNMFKHKKRLVVRKQNHMKIRYKLIRSHHEHVHFLSHIFYINKKLISPLMYIGTINILTLSTYLIVFLWFHKMSPHFKKVLIFFWVCQMIFFIIALWNYIQLNDELIRLTTPLYNILLLINRNDLPIQLRWKLSTYYEMLNRSIKPLLITVGPLGELTKQSVNEMTFFYCAILIFFIGKFITNESFI